MDGGKISVRYARALLLLAQEQRCENEVYNNMVTLTSNYSLALSQFNEILSNPILSKEEKSSLLKNAVGETIHPTVSQFIDFVTQQNREDKIYVIALKFQEMYREAHDILRTDVTTAAELSEKSLRQIKGFVEQTFDCTAEMHVKVDPSLIGGFVLDLEHDRMDASVAGQLEALKKKLK